MVDDHRSIVLLIVPLQENRQTRQDDLNRIDVDGRLPLQFDMRRTDQSAMDENLDERLRQSKISQRIEQVHRHRMITFALDLTETALDLSTNTRLIILQQKIQPSLAIIPPAPSHQMKDIQVIPSKFHEVRISLQMPVGRRGKPVDQRVLWTDVRRQRQAKFHLDLRSVRFRLDKLEDARQRAFHVVEMSKPLHGVPVGRSYVLHRLVGLGFVHRRHDVIEYGRKEFAVDVIIATEATRQCQRGMI